MKFDYSVTTHDRQTSIVTSGVGVDQVLEILEEAHKFDLDPCMLRVYLCYEGKPLMWMQGSRFLSEVSKFDETVFE